MINVACHVVMHEEIDRESPEVYHEEYKDHFDGLEQMARETPILKNQLRIISIKERRNSFFFF